MSNIYQHIYQIVKTLHTFKNAKLSHKLLVALFLWAAYAFFKNKGWLSKKSLKGDHVFITGAGSGIGRQLSILLAEQGAKISASDINFESVQETVRLIKNQYGKAVAIFCDVSKSSSVKDAAAEARAAFGAVTILVNNAGIVSGKKILQNSETMIEKTMQINTTSHAYTVREFLPDMLKLKKGHIVTIASAAGTLGVAGLVDYCASKFGAFGFDESLRMELKKLKSNVRTTCICPSYIDTGMFEGAKSKFSFLMPIMKQEYASKRILNAIRQNEEVVLMPWFCNTVLLSRGILPVWLFDKVATFSGTNDGMDEFKGRSSS